MICKFMGWSADDFFDAPAEWTPIILEMMKEQAERYGAKESTEPEEPEIERVETPSGLVREQRKRTPGDMVLHNLFGTPKSFRK